ncbi:MAG: N-acetylmuramoyl-L-alanine amidase [bacterium]|nr:N-acetylmuramoyl-L-alanine amidase [bacterium]
MKRLFFLILIYLYTIFTTFPVMADESPLKVMSLNYDNSSSVICISTTDGSKGALSASTQKYVRLTNPNRIYFDINDAILLGEKQQLVFENSPITGIKLAQFSTNPNIVRTVITFQEDFDTSKINLIASDNLIIAKIGSLKLKNEYYHTIYNDNSINEEYSHIKSSSQVIQKTNIPLEVPNGTNPNVIKEIQSAFGTATLNNTDGNKYDSISSVDLSSNLKLRTKYYINQYIPKNNGLLVSGIGQVSAAKMFYLQNPSRMVIDLPNTYLDKSFRNKEVVLAPLINGGDSAKIGQFDYNTARIVITSPNANKYIPIYSKDLQSLFIANIDSLDHTKLEQTPSNILGSQTKKINSKNGEITFTFTAPVVHSIVKNDENLNIYLFNVQNYNEQNFLNSIKGSLLQKMKLSLLPKNGVKISMPLHKGDLIKIDESIDSKNLKISYSTEIEQKSQIVEQIDKERKPIKNKIVLDAGHGGSDYGAIREGINEKDITFDVTMRVASLLKSKGYKVALTRTQDSYVSLEDRTIFTENENPEVFVSIHVNSTVSTDPNGIETHWYHEQSKPLAEIIQKHFTKEIPDAKDRGLFKSMFYVINHTTAPAVLCEIGFLSNEAERNKLLTNERKQKTANAIADGIIEFIKSNKI